MMRSESSVIPFLVPRRKVWLPCSNAANILQENARLGRKVNFAPGTGRLPLGVKAPKCIHSVLAQEMAKHCVEFVWPPLSDVGAVGLTKPRREARWNLLGCPKLANRSLPLVGRNSPYCEDMWRGYCCLTFLISIYTLVAKIQPIKLCDGAQMAIFA